MCYSEPADGIAERDGTVRVFISADMEGVTGLVAASELLPEGPDYPRFRALMTADVNAAIDGLVAGGADQSSSATRTTIAATSSSKTSTPPRA